MRGDRWTGLLKGAIGLSGNDSRFLLDVHSRDLPGEDTMRRYRDDEEVDLVIVGAGAGGSVLAQRLARAGWLRCLEVPGRRDACSDRGQRGG